MTRVAKKTRKHAEDLRAASRLAVDATERVTNVVEAMHNTIGGGPALLGKPLAGPVRLVNGLVYGSIRGVTRLVGTSIDRLLAQIGPLLGESVPGPEREAAVAVLNGVVGDYLAETGSPFAIEMRLRSGGVALEIEKDALRAAFPDTSGKLLVLVHGSSMNDLQWKRHGMDYGALLAHDLGVSPLYLQYNSGLHVSANGRELDALMDRLVEAWPVPVSEIVMLCHSMGGLVARSACLSSESRNAGEARGWRGKLTKLVFLGTPHHGAPLERGGNLFHVLLGISRYSAPLARLATLRSAGVTDLRYGNVLDEHWASRDRFAYGRDTREALALPAGVACYAIAGQAAPEGQRSPFGDGLVPVASALGQHDRAHMKLDFPEGHTWIAYGVGHIDLLGRAEVYSKILELLTSS